MIIHALAFYMFSSFLIFASIMVISVRNPVHSVLFLILAFFNAAGLFVLLGAEFLAMVLVIVYVGAVAVLFMFVVMMLDIGTTDLQHGFLQYLPIAAIIGVILLVELLFILGNWHLNSDILSIITEPIPPAQNITNTHALGLVLYTRYIYLFQCSGLILLIAMVGAIVLTHRRRKGVHKQKISDQIARRAEKTVEVQDVKVGTGI